MNLVDGKKPDSNNPWIVDFDEKEDMANDSLLLDLALKDAFKIFKENLMEKDFEKTYTYQPYIDNYEMKINIKNKKIFNDNFYYILLLRTLNTTTYLNIYKVKNGKLESLVETKLNSSQGCHTINCYTIMDVNGDGNDDLVTDGGCVFLNLSDKGVFSEKYEFSSPIFSPEEKIIRGIVYDKYLYKYKWNGSRVDTIEHIYKLDEQYLRMTKRVKDFTIEHIYNLDGKDLKEAKIVSDSTREYGDVLDTVPKEYQEVSGVIYW